MRADLIDILCCPLCQGSLQLSLITQETEICDGELICTQCARRYQITEGIPDLVPSSE